MANQKASEERIEKMVTMYNSGLTNYQISLLEHITPQGVNYLLHLSENYVPRKRVKKVNEARRGRGRPRKLAAQQGDSEGAGQ